MAEQISLHTWEKKEKEEAVALEPHSRLMASTPHRRPSSEGHMAAVLSSEPVREASGWETL